MNQCNDFWCPNRNIYTGYCKLTACSKPITHNEYKSYNNNSMVIFPQTIGDITFYSKQELFNWVITQQKMNKDPDYGRGIYS